MLGAPTGTLTVRILAILLSLASLLLWLGVLGRTRKLEGHAESTRRARMLLVLLWTIPAPLVLKLTLSYWGTHDLVIVVHAALVLILCGVLRSPVSGRRGLGRAAVVAVLCATATALNTSLLLPTCVIT